MAVAWSDHIAAFHAARPGITEDVLSGCRDGATTPYGWLVDGLDPTAPTLDLACGSGPARPPGASAWVGVDLSAPELRRACAVGRTAVACADVARLPVADRSAAVVTCSMALMLVADLGAVLAEVARVLRPDGEVRLLLPARRPLTSADRWHHAHLMLAARTVPAWPSTPLHRRGSQALAAVGLTVVDDGSLRFVLDLTTAEDARRYVDSWYAPQRDDDQRAAAGHRVGPLAPLTLGLPLRRVVARPSLPSAAAPLGRRGG